MQAEGEHEPRAAVDDKLATGDDSALIQYDSAVEVKSSLFTIFCSGAALISDGLQNNIFSLTNIVFGQLYGSGYTTAFSTQIANSLTIGTILGQISVGYICDRFGRKVGIVTATTLIVVGIILATAAHGAGGSLIGFFWFLTIARGITGFGVGAEYSCSSASAIEAANDRNVKHRGAIFILVTNLVLSLGGPVASILYLIVFEAAGGLNANLSTVWRTVFGISVIPPLFVFYFRISIKDSKLYRQSAIQHNIPFMLTIKYYWRTLIGTAGAWFMYDFVVFPNGVFSGTIISSLVKSKGPELIKQTAQYQLLLGAIAIPGIFIGIALLPRFGRRNTMMLGFSGYVIFGLSVGLAYNTVASPNNIGLFIFLYGAMTSMGNLGPGNQLGLISSESYATPVRGMMYGLSAAIGKFGAVVGNQSFLPIRTQLGPRFTFIIAAGIGFLGIVLTFFFVRNDLDGDLTLEDAKFRAYLEANGWQGAMGLKVETSEEKGETPADGTLFKSDSEEDQKTGSIGK